MKNSLRLALASVALLTAPLSLSAAEACCAATKTTAAKSEGGCCAAKAQAQSVMLKIGGGDCSGINTALAKVKGVKSVETCSETKFTKVAFCGEQARTGKILTALRRAGYTVEAQRVTLSVDGLACGSCAEKVTQALSKVKGVADSKVCHESKQAVVDFNPRKVSEERIIAAIDAAGFKASEAMN